MMLKTPYAPGSFLKPCVVVSTLFNTKTRETALIWVEALNAEHALAYGGDHAPRHSEWVIIQHHATREAAIAFHLDLTAPFINGGSNEEWERGWEPYLALYEQHCPREFRESATSSTVGSGGCQGA